MLKREFIKKDETKILNLRITEKEFARIKENANLYCEGNVSAWMRYSAINLKPLKKDIKKPHEK